MRTVIIDGRRCKSKEQAHEYIARKLQMPSYYGKNLDALYDILTSFDERIHLRIRYFSKVETRPNDYRSKLLKVFDDAAKENKRIFLEMI